MMPALDILSYALLASIAGVPPQVSIAAPAGVLSMLRSAKAQMEFAGDCLEGHPNWGLDGRYDRLDKRASSLSREIGDVWGELKPEPFDDSRPGQRRCRRSSAKDNLRDVERALARVKAQLAIAALPLRRGAWIGSLALCRDSVRNATFGVEHFTGQDTLAMRMTKRGRSLFARMTEKRVGQSVAVRVDGRVIAAPQIDETNEDGMIELTGPDRSRLERVRIASTQRC